MNKNISSFKNISSWLIAISMTILTACNGGGGEGKFSVLDAPETATSASIPITVQISAQTPVNANVSMASKGLTTFGVTLVVSDDKVKFKFVLDDTTTLQDDSNPFYALDPALLSTGSHSLKVTAYNDTSSDSFQWNITINSPVAINNFAPNLTGTNISCGVDSTTLSALYSDNNLDAVNIKWYVNDLLVSFGNTTANATNDPTNNIAMLNFHPNCTQGGVNFIRVDLFDGKEITSETWTIFVTSPITINIADAIPVIDPIVMTNSSSTTFAVTLTTPDQAANYNFVLDGTISLQNDHRTYINLAGSTLSPGTHTLRVLVANSTSSDSHTFNIRKNSPPQLSTFNPSFSGNSLACGTTPLTLYADMIDPNGDNLSYTWTIDDAPSAYIIPANSGNRAQASFVPNCGIAGTRVVKVNVTDGFESTTVKRCVKVTTTKKIKITSFSPSTNPTVLISGQTTTFAVALSNSDSSVNYSFILKNLSTLTTQTLQSGTVPFYNLISNSIAGGLYELNVIASNGTSSDSHAFIVRKNSAPALPPPPQTFSPTLTGVTLSCGSSSQVFRSALADADNDIMSISWYLDGATAPLNLVNNSTQSEVRATYSPSCMEVGIKNIRVDVFDGHETTTKTWTVNIINPTIVTINGYSPSTDPVQVMSQGSQTFTVSASGKDPLVYEWKLDGNLISSATGAFTTLSAASLSTGNHTLVAKVSDADSTASHSFSIIKNQPPVLSNRLPANQNPKININTIINFSANYMDANNDTMTVQWKLNNIVVSGSNLNAAVSGSAGSTTLTLSPSSSIIGDNTIELVITDGKEPTSFLWNINVNYFSDICNNMGAGRACTIVGRPGMGSGIDPVVNPEYTRIQPMFITPYGDSSGSYFFTDPNTHTAWFYNKSATPITMLGQVFGAGRLSIIAGIGMNGIGISGISYNDFPLNTPRGLAWDAINKRVYISNEATNQIVMLDNDGVVNIVAGGGANNTAGNTNGSLATSSYCATPRGLFYHSTQQKLYVACAGSGTIKYIDTSATNFTLWTATMVTGRASGGVTTNNVSTDGSNGVAGTAQLMSPNHLKYDLVNDVLYVTTSGDCRVRGINMTGLSKTNFWYGSVTLPASATSTYIGVNCTTLTTGAYASARFNGGWMGLELKMNGSIMEGMFVSDYNTHRITYINNSAASTTLGGSLIPSNSMSVIWGNPTGTAGYYMPCASANATTCYLNNPSSLYIFNNKLFVADYSNFRIRTLSLATSNGAIVDDIGFDSKRGYAGNGGTSSENVQFNMPINLYYDDYANKLYISDFFNYRIRSLNMVNGRIDSFISNGAGDANTSNADPSIVGTRGPRGVVNYQNKIIYADNQNNNCVLRALNTDSTNQNILGVLTNANAVQTIAGNWGQGCGAWNITATTGTHSTARLNNPQGVTTDGSNIYFANTNAHCIIKLDSVGNMSVLAGLCGTPGAANGSGTPFTNSTIRFMNPTAVVVDPKAPYATAGNLFILDQTTGGTLSKVRYLNQYSSAVTIYGTTINPGEIKTIYSAADSYTADLATFDTMVCFSSGGNYSYVGANGSASTSNNNVICFNRDESTGTNYFRFGRAPGSFIGHGAQPYNTEEEGAPATSISFAGPAGLAFDENGNLYVSEREAHSIRMIKKWW